MLRAGAALLGLPALAGGLYLWLGSDVAAAAKPATPPPPAFDWNGFYSGAYAGAAWMDQATTNDPCLVTLTAFCLATGVGTFNGVPPSTTT